MMTAKEWKALVRKAKSLIDRGIYKMEIECKIIIEVERMNAINDYVFDKITDPFVSEETAETIRKLNKKAV